MLLYGLFSRCQPIAFPRLQESSSSRIEDSDLRKLPHNLPRLRLLVLYHCGPPDSARDWASFACKCLFARRDFGFVQDMNCRLVEPNGASGPGESRSREGRILPRTSA
jgi:hypothetical protein